MPPRLLEDGAVTADGGTAKAREASVSGDNRLADKAAGITAEKRQAEGYTWHHHQDGKTMQLIKRDVHRDFFHTGGMAGAR